jgi:2-polyprenyl-3-methyl-5-hydroxy-6-metoxy-1,4-benzoquinol methylase
LNQVSLFALDDSSELVTCVEVGEHLEKGLSDNVVESVVRNIKPNGILIWTAAIPGQGGVGHINCQEKEYWQEKFEKKNMIRNVKMEKELIEYMLKGSYMGWFINNVMIFIMT